jgi:hypothetical protein
MSTVSPSQVAVSPQNRRSEHVRQILLSHDRKTAGQSRCLTVSPYRGSLGETDPRGGQLPEVSYEQSAAVFRRGRGRSGGIR